MKPTVNYIKNLDELKKDPDNEICYEDEAHFYRSTTITRMHAKIGQQPQIPCPTGKLKTAYFGFVLPEMGTLFTYECAKFNFETFIEATKEYVVKHPVPIGKTRIVILDRASWHKKGVRLMQECDLFDGRVKFAFLPAYSPDLNPIERVWRITRKKRTHNRFFDTLGMLKKVLSDFFDSLSLPNELLKSLCQ